MLALIKAASATTLFCGVAMCYCQEQNLRWCNAPKLMQSDVPVYPPIAKAAHVSGPVLARVKYRVSGEVASVQIEQGPPILAASLQAQLAEWHFETSTTGVAPCQMFLITDFTLGDQKAIQNDAPTGILRVAVHADVILLVDPAGTTIRRRWYSRLF